MIPILLALVGADALALGPVPCRPPHRATGRPTSIGSIVSASYPIRVHWSREGDEAMAQLILEHIELSWAEQVDGLGFRAPHLPDSADGDELDVYLAPAGYGSAYADVDVWADQIPGDGYNTAASFIVVDQDLPEAWIPGYMAHEFNHVLQWGTDFSEWTLPLWEGVATAAQTWTLGPDGDWDADVGSFQEIPWYPTLLGDSYAIYYEQYVGAYYEYGTALWVAHLEQVAGVGPTAGALLWEAAANEGAGLEPDVVDAFADVSGLELGDALNELARTRFLTGEDWDERGLAEAADWNPAQQVPLEIVRRRDLPLDHTFEVQPMITGQAFVEIGGIGGAEAGESLVVRASSASGLHAGILVMWWGADGSVGDLGAHGPEPVVELDLAGVDRVVVALTNLGSDAFDPDGENFYAHGDHVLHLELTGAEPEPDPEPDPGGSGGDSVEEEKPGGCSVSGSGPSGILALIALVAVARRRP